MGAAEQYVVDEKGNKVAIILPLTEYCLLYTSDAADE